MEPPSPFSSRALSSSQTDSSSWPPTAHFSVPQPLPTTFYFLFLWIWLLWARPIRGIRVFVLCDQLTSLSLMSGFTQIVACDRGSFLKAAQYSTVCVYAFAYLFIPSGHLLECFYLSGTVCYEHGWRNISSCPCFLSISKKLEEIRVERSLSYFQASCNHLHNRSLHDQFKIIITNIHLSWVRPELYPALRDTGPWPVWLSG